MNAVRWKAKVKQKRRDHFLALMREKRLQKQKERENSGKYNKS